MCAIDDCEPWTVVNHTKPKARKEYPCIECGRTIRVGETYAKCVGLCEGYWSTSHSCLHCEAMGQFMREMCGSWPISQLREELEEHWRDGYASVAFGRLVACMRLKWHDGADPLPEDTGDLAKQLMAQSLARGAP
jgi:hypothetical protein